MTNSRSAPAAPSRSAAALGYRTPAEFEPVERIWLTPPHNRDTWPGCFDEAAAQFEQFIKAASRFAKVELIGRDHDWPTNDSWVRDYGPIFVVRDQRSHIKSEIPNPKSEIPSLACHDFTFNGWGGKYEAVGYDAPIDDVIPQRIADHLSIPCWKHGMVLEGGSIEVNGRGVVMTTRQCLRNENRNPDLSLEQIEAKLHEALGTRHVVWLPGGIEGDDTDGHIDDVARFVAPDAIAAIRAPRDHPDHAMLERNWAALAAARDANGQPFNLLELPVPQPIHYDYPADANHPAERRPLPASYANFLIVNDGVIVPVFGQRSDDAALRAIEKALPGRSAVPVRCDRLVVGMGAVHCLSMQQPAVATTGDGGGAR